MNQHEQGRRICLAALAGLALPAGARAATVGQAAPALVLPGLNGSVDLAASRGRVVYLDFWASWCGPCKQSFPWLNRMQAAYGARGLQVLAVNLDRQRADADAFLARTPAQFTLAFDPAGDSARRFAIQGMPSSLLIGADGLVILQHTGFREQDQAALEAAIVAALGRVAAAASRPL